MLVRKPSINAHLLQYALLQSNPIIHRDGDLLLGSQVALRRLDRRVPQQELDLLQIAAGLAAELRAGPPQIVGAEALDADLLGGFASRRTRSPSRSGSPRPCRPC